MGVYVGGFVSAVLPPFGIPPSADGGGCLVDQGHGGYHHRRVRDGVRKAEAYGGDRMVRRVMVVGVGMGVMMMMMMMIMTIIVMTTFRIGG
jgi:hypothetical protein